MSLRKLSRSRVRLLLTLAVSYCCQMLSDVSLIARIQGREVSFYYGCVLSLPCSAFLVGVQCFHPFLWTVPLHEQARPRFRSSLVDLISYWEWLCELLLAQTSFLTA